MVLKIIKTMLKYKVIQRKNPIDKSVKYYAQEVEQTQMSFATIKSKGAATAKDFEPKLLRNIMIRWVRPTRFRAAFDLEKGKVRVQKV